MGTFEAMTYKRTASTHSEELVTRVKRSLFVRLSHALAYPLVTIASAIQLSCGSKVNESPNTPSPVPSSPQSAPQTPVNQNPASFPNANAVPSLKTPPPLEWKSYFEGDADVSNVKSGAPGVAVFESGYGASLADARAWATQAIADSALSNTVARAWTFRGPDTVDYGTKHFPNSRLATALASDPSTGLIQVFAHSSGAFVADEFIAQLKARGAGTRTIVYILDGIYSANLTTGLKLSTGVWAHVGSSASRNAASMKIFPRNKSIVPLNPACTSPWCLHFGTVTTRPSGNLANDYRSTSSFPLFLD